MLIKEVFFHYKMCYNFKSIKAKKENIPYIPYIRIPIPSKDLC